MSCNVRHQLTTYAGRESRDEDVFWILRIVEQLARWGSGLGKIMVFVAEKTFLAYVLAIPMNGTPSVKFWHCFVLAQTLRAFLSVHSRSPLLWFHSPNLTYDWSMRIKACRVQIVMVKILINREMILKLYTHIYTNTERYSSLLIHENEKGDIWR